MGVSDQAAEPSAFDTWTKIAKPGGAAVWDGNDTHRCRTLKTGIYRANGEQVLPS